MSGNRAGAIAAAARRYGIDSEEYLRQVALGYKFCRLCRAWQPVDCFAADSSRGDGRVTACRESLNETRRRAYVPRPRQTGRRFVAPRDDDRLQARRRVNYLIEARLLPPPNDRPCADCGHLWVEGGPRHEYDHHLGYTAEHHEDVEAVCSGCHHAREATRRAA